MSAGIKKPSAIERAWNWFFYVGYSGDSLGALRALLGGGLLLYHISQFPHVLILDPNGARAQFIEPIWYFVYLGIDTHIPWLNIPIFILMMLATVFFMIGKWTKPSILVMVICIFYLKGVRDSFAGDVHHRYLVPVTMLFFFFFSKCNHRFALDAKKYKDKVVEEWEASWPIRASQAYIVMFYFWAVVAKLRMSGWEWFSPAGLIQSRLLSRSLRSGFNEEGSLIRRAYAFDLAEHIWIVFTFGVIVAVFELLAPLVLVLRKRWVTVFFLIGAAGFHIANYILLNVQFFIYPFVFFTFFNMAWFAQKYRKDPVTGPVTGLDNSVSV